MSREILTAESVNDAIVSIGIASEITEYFNTGSNRLTSIKVCINTKYRKANIYAGYEDTARLLESGSEETMASLCEALIKWPQDELGENTEETWKDLSYPKRQMERAFMLSVKLNQQFIILSYSDDLKCYIENGNAHIEKI
jgi:DNA phosphorothioation-dependent restriction protein DptG